MTGLICSGKSGICSAMEREGVNTVSADSIIRELQKPGGVIYESIRERWGDLYIAEDGRLNRSLLSRDILKDSRFRKEVESISHPPALTAIKEFLLKNETEGAWAAAAEVPLLFEAGWEKHFDISVLAEAPEHILLERIAERKGVDIAEARQWIELRPLRDKLHLMADVRVDTSGNPEETAADVKKIIRRLRRNINENK